MMEWISVKDHLPPYLKKVIIFFRGKEARKFSPKGVDFGAWYTKQYGWLHSDGCQAEGVTHWMEMPEPPNRSLSKIAISPELLESVKTSRRELNEVSEEFGFHNVIMDAICVLESIEKGQVAASPTSSGLRGSDERS
jgi:hypothetical protein